MYTPQRLLRLLITMLEFHMTRALESMSRRMRTIY